MLSMSFSHLCGRQAVWATVGRQWGKWRGTWLASVSFLATLSWEAGLRPPLLPHPASKYSNQWLVIVRSPTLLQTHLHRHPLVESYLPDYGQSYVYQEGIAICNNYQSSFILENICSNRSWHGNKWKWFRIKYKSVPGCHIPHESFWTDNTMFSGFLFSVLLCFYCLKISSQDSIFGVLVLKRLCS